MPSIHPTAIIDDKAQLAPDVAVGPYTVIAANVTIGEGTTIGAHCVIEGRTTIGSGNRIGHHVVLGTAPQDLKYRGGDTELTVGDGNDFREFVTAHRGTENGGGLTSIANRCLLMVGAHVAHDSHLHDRVIMANRANLAGHVTIERCAIVSGGAGVHHFVSIGQHAFVGGNAGVVHDCPPFMISDGHPARVRGVNVIGLQRHGFDDEAIERLKTVYKLIYKREAGNVADGIAQVESMFNGDPHVGEVCRWARRTAEGLHGRYHEAHRHDNKRRTPTR